MGRRAALLALLVLAAAGCGGAGSNGEARKPAGQVVADARRAALAATAVHVVGTTSDNGTPLDLDLWLARGRAEGHFLEGGQAFDAVRIGDAIWAHGGTTFLRRLLGPRAAGTRWIRGSAKAGLLAPLAPLLDRRAFLQATLGQHGALENRGTKTYGGQRVVEIRDTTQGGSLYVAAHGTPYPIALVGGSGQGDVAFDGWGSAPAIRAPG